MRDKRQILILTQGPRMNLILLTVVMGAGVALLVLAGLFLFEQRRKKAAVDLTEAPGKHPVAALGLQAEPQMTLNTVVMRPTLGLRIFSLGFGAGLMLLIWGPFAGFDGLDAFSKLALTLLTFYATVMIAHYEARYDDEGLTAPDLFFREKTYAWADFEGIKAQGTFVYRMRFGGQRPLHLQKYLVGMPTFLRFLKDVETVQQRA